MTAEVLMPKMGYDMTEGTVRRWLKAEGDPVTPGEAIGEIETGKVDIEIEAFDGGVLARILVAEGGTVPVGTPIAIIAAPGEALPDLPAATAGEQLPDTPAAGPSAAASASAATRLPGGPNGPDRAGRSNAVAVAPGDEASVRPEPQAPGGAGGRLRASPLARRLAAEQGIDPRELRGSGPRGRVVRDDVLAAAAAATGLHGADGAAVTFGTQGSSPARAGAGRDGTPGGRIVVSPMRRTIARRLTGSWTSAPHIFVTMSIDVTEALALRGRVNEALASSGVKVSVNDMVVKAAADQLRRDPRLNVSWADGEIVVHDRVNVGSAVALEAGLFTVVVPDADTMRLPDLAAELAERAARARGGKLAADDMATEGTFTVTNLGMYGVDEFTAIINPPEAAILAVGAAIPTPVARDGRVEVRSIMKVTLSADHRAVDGATAAQFLAGLKESLEQPLRLIL